MDNICFPKGIIIGEPLIYGGPNTLCNTRSDKISANKDHVTCAACRMTLGLPINPTVTPLKSFTTEITKTGEENKVEQKITEFKQDLTPHIVEMWTGYKGRPCFSIKVSSSEPSMATELAVEQYNRLAKATDPKFKEILLDQIIPLTVPEIKPIKNEKSHQDLIDKYAHLHPRKNSFGFFLRKYRNEHSVKIITVSEAMNEEVEDIYMFECNMAWPTNEQLLLLSEILNLNDKQYSKLKQKLIEETK
jgi:hypothetical protein